MALVLGDVTADANGNVLTSTGVVGRCFEQLKIAFEARLAAPLAPGPTLGAFVAGMIGQAKAQGRALHAVLTIDARAKVSTETSGIQRLPGVFVVGLDTIPPSVDKFLPIV